MNKKQTIYQSVQPFYRKYRDREFVLDDECYFTKRRTNSNGNDIFYSNNKDLAPANIKFKKVAKFEYKLLVYIVISPRGVSEPFIQPSGNAVNQFIYRDNCLASLLLPFIKKYHSDGNYIFWPDLASSHYAEHAIDFLCENLVHHVDKKDNPANLPEARPIEDFWALVKNKVYGNNWEAKNLEQLEVKIRKCLKEMDIATIQRTMGKVKKRLDKIRRLDIIENRK